MRFENLDLNLLNVLDALLSERSVSLAAERVHLSQSATSSSLARLRAFFGDELLVMRGRRMILTPRAEELVLPVGNILALIRETIATPKPFDPKVSDRNLVVMTSDYSTEVLLAPTIRTLFSEAPHMTFDIRPVHEDPIVQLERSVVQIVITTETFITTEHPSCCLFSDDFVVVGWKGNPALSTSMTRELYSELGHVATRIGQAQLPSFEAYALKYGSIDRRIAIVAPNFVSVASLVQGSDHIATMHRCLAKRLQSQNELVIFEPPFHIPPVRIRAQWLTSNGHDPALAWFIKHLQAKAAQLFSGCADGPCAAPLIVAERLAAATAG